MLDDFGQEINTDPDQNLGIVLHHTARHSSQCRSEGSASRICHGALAMLQLQDISHLEGVQARTLSNSAPYSRHSSQTTIGLPGASPCGRTFRTPRRTLWPTPSGSRQVGKVSCHDPYCSRHRAPATT
jgi:hypothetical protein